LGQRFWDEVDEHIAWIAENPDVPRPRRRISARELKDIPLLSFVCRSQRCDLVAVAHGHTEIQITPQSMRRQVHIEKKLHAPASTTSRSSARHAAYRSACRMSSRSRQGYSARSSSTLRPAPICPTIIPTVTRIPRTQALPLIISGRCVMRSSFSMQVSRAGHPAILQQRADILHGRPFTSSRRPKGRVAN